VEKVKVIIPGCGSFYAKHDDPTVLRQMIMDDLRIRDISCEEIKRGPKKKPA